MYGQGSLCKYWSSIRGGLLPALQGKRWMAAGTVPLVALHVIRCIKGQRGCNISCFGDPGRQRGNIGLFPAGSFRDWQQQFLRRMQSANDGSRDRTGRLSLVVSDAAHSQLHTRGIRSVLGNSRHQELRGCHLYPMEPRRVLTPRKAH